MTKHAICLLAFGLLAAAASIAIAQTPSQIAEVTLPDSPGAVVSGTAYALGNSSSSFQSASLDSASTQRTAPPVREASRLENIISPGQQAPSLTFGDKFLMGAKDTVTPLSPVGWIISSGYSHLMNGAPNYGTDRGAYGQRLGATAIRDISEGFFSTSIMANVFHEDPRYYRMGREHGIVKRSLYAVTRAIITRTDSGRTTPNLALLTGNLAGAALTNAYYPPLNHGARQTMLIFGSSVGGSALGFGVNEFLSDALELVHLKKSE